MSIYPQVKDRELVGTYQALVKSGGDMFGMMFWITEFGVRL